MENGPFEEGKVDLCLYQFLSVAGHTRVGLFHVRGFTCLCSHLISAAGNKRASSGRGFNVWCCQILGLL